MVYKGWAYHTKTPYKEYLASWRQDGRGDNVVFTTYMLNEPWGSNRPDRYYYTVELNGVRQDGRSGSHDYERYCANQNTPGTDGLSGAAVGIKNITLSTCTFKLTSDRVGVLKVSLYVVHCGLFAGCEDKRVAAASALVESGATFLDVDGGSRVFQEGDKLKLRVRTGSCGMREASPGFAGCYALNILDSTGRVVCEKNRPGEILHCPTTFTVKSHAGDTRWGRTSYEVFEWVVPKGAFKPRDPFDNQWRVELMNTIVSAKTVTIFTVDSLDKIPPPPKVTLSPQPLIEGTRGTITIEAKSNPNGTLDLRRARVYVWYGGAGSQPGLGSDDWILNGANVTLEPTTSSGGSGAARTFQATTTFPVPKDGEVQVQVFVIDTDGRASQPSAASALTVNGARTQPDLPTTGAHRTLAGVVLLLGIAAIVAVIALVRKPIYRYGASAGIGLAVLGFVGWVYATAGGAW